jgi:cell wall-associated NlpC family hydrolase
MAAGLSLLAFGQSASAQEATSGGTAVEAAPAVTTPAATTPAASSATPPTALQTQSVRLTSTQTKSVQRRVNVRPDGVLGAGTRVALKRFQTKQELTKTGRPNVETLRALKLKLADKLEAQLAAGQTGSGATLAGSGNAAASAAGAVTAVRAQTGVPYRTAGTTTSGFDCSGLTQYAYEKAGVDLPRTSFDQYKEGVAVQRADIQAGDLVFFNTAGSGASHVGIATGATTVISATSSGVMEHKSNDSYWGSHYVGARRLSDAT